MIHNRLKFISLLLVSSWLRVRVLNWRLSQSGFDPGYGNLVCLATLMSSDRTKQICLWMTIYIYIYIYSCIYRLRERKRALEWEGFLLSIKVCTNLYIPILFFSPTSLYVYCYLFISLSLSLSLSLSPLPLSLTLSLFVFNSFLLIFYFDNICFYIQIIFSHLILFRFFRTIFHFCFSTSNLQSDCPFIFFYMLVWIKR